MGGVQEVGEGVNGRGAEWRREGGHGRLLALDQQLGREDLPGRRSLRDKPLVTGEVGDEVDRGHPHF